MPYPTGTFVATDLAVTINEVWSGEAINDFFKAELQKVVGFWTDYSSLLQNGGDVLHIPNLLEMTAYEKSNATAVTLSSPTETETQLQVTEWWNVAFAIEDMQAQQVLHSYDLQSKLMRNAGYTVAKVLATDLMGLYGSLTSTVGTSTTVVVDSTIRKAIGILDNNNVPQEDRCFFFSPFVMWDQVMNIDRFVLSINNGGAYSPVSGTNGQAGGVGNLYGFPVVSTTLVVLTNTNAAAHNIFANKEAFCYAKSLMRLQSQYKLEYLSTLSVADILYGVACQRANAGVHIVSSISIPA